MKKFSPAFVLVVISFLLVLFSCKKINEATSLGGDLIPAVDNVNTFEVFLDATTKNLLLSNFLKNDSGHRVRYRDVVALGDINDPEFGNVHANFCFNLSASSYRSSPFQDSINTIDSVILSLRYAGAYGDTFANGMQTVSVYEIPYNGAGTGLSSDSLYRYNDPASDFTGNMLGSATYLVRNLDDSITIINPGDTFKTANVLRIKLNTSLANKLTTLTTDSAVGGYYSDSLFKTFFNGLAVKAGNTGNVLSYFNLTDTSTKLIVYYKYNLNGKDTTAITQFYHSANGQSNYVNIQPGANWAAALADPNADKLYIQSSPSGSFASIKIPGLDTFSNKVVHRAEIIATTVPSASDNVFTAPPRLLLDRLSPNGDSAYLFEKDLSLGSDGSIGYELFGGNLRSDNTFRFNITRYVQGIITRKERNDSLRLWAPLRSWEYSSMLGTYIELPVNNRIGEGRVVLGSGNHPNPNTRLRLRIVYSNL